MSDQIVHFGGSSIHTSYKLDLPELVHMYLFHLGWLKI